MHESELLSHIRARSADLGAAFGHVLVGPGDDCAVIRLGGSDILLKVDQLVEGRHFRAFPSTPVDLVARKSIARAVSDIAAMGGAPRAALAAATLPSGFSLADALFDAMAKWAKRWSCPLVGGDIAMWRVETQQSSKAPEQQSGSARSAGLGVVLSVTIVGEPHPVRGPVLRSGARIGDAVYVTGALGGSFDPLTGLGKHLTFEPRLAEARWLCDTLGTKLHAMMDISDGLGRDAGRMAEASGVCVEIFASQLPLAGLAAGRTKETTKPVTSVARGWRGAVSDGEDYELLFTAAPEAEVPGVCPGTGTAIHRIGRVAARTDAARCRVFTTEGDIIEASEMGWEHL